MKRCLPWFIGFAALLAIPLTFSLVLRVAEAAAARPRGPNMLLMATRTLRATTTRSLARTSGRQARQTSTHLRRPR